MHDHHTSRCAWAEKPAIYVDYHDLEWGVPLHDDQKIFEFLTLEAFQAGLSWLTVLRKRPAFREAFDGFDPVKVAAYDDDKRAELVANAAIIRNRAKIDATITNARAFLAVQEAFGTFDRYMWGFVDGAPIVNRFASMGELPAKTALAERFSHDLKVRGFRFMGPTVVYAHMQATGMVNDHVVTCFRHAQLCAGS